MKWGSELKAFIKKYYQQLSLTKKIMLYYIPLSILPIIMVAIIMSGTYRNLIIDRTLSSATDNSYLIINQTESIFDSADDCGNLLTININNIYEGIGEADLPTSNVSITNAISNELSFALLTYPNIESVAFYDVKGGLYTSTHRLTDTNMDFYKSNLFDVLKTTTGPSHWFPLTKRDYLTLDSEVAILTMGKKVVNINDGTTYGYLLVNISENSISHSLDLQEYDYWIINENDSIISTNSEDIVLDQMNTVIFDKDLLDESSYIGVRELNGNSYITTMFPFKKANWRLIGQLPYDDLTSDLQQLTIYMFALLVAIILLDIFTSWIFSYNISKPIRALNNGMLKVSQGNFSQRLEETSRDEIGSMADSFNHMSEKIENLLLTVEEEQLQKREYEMALIQEQIKPHFLYNCLDVIYTLNLMGRQQDAAKATKALADYYRVSLSKGADIITLEEEVKNVKDYLSLQKIRYSDVFDYTIDFPPELSKYKIIKLTLQPLVENAIYHGLKMKETFGMLTIKLFMVDELITIEVIDNGQGMDTDTLSTILEPKDKREHFGLYNVKHRIQLFFGEEYGLDIDSELGQGTRVSVTIPASLSIAERRTT